MEIMIDILGVCQVTSPKINILFVADSFIDMIIMLTGPGLPLFGGHTLRPQHFLPRPR